MAFCTATLSRGGNCGRPIKNDSFCGVHIRSNAISLAKLTEKAKKHVAKEQDALYYYGLALYAVGIEYNSHDDQTLAEHQYIVAWREWEDVVYSQYGRLIVAEPGIQPIVERLRTQAKTEDEEHASEPIAQTRLYARQIEEEIMLNVIQEGENDFVQDPIGDIDLRNFSSDRQNVHRSSIQQANLASIRILMDRPLLEGQQTLDELSVAFLKDKNEQDTYRIRNVLCEVRSDISRNVKCFDYLYKDVLDHVWATLCSHECKEELIVRLLQELEDGSGTCSNGKICRLLNVLHGFDKEITTCISREAFQSKFATLVSLPISERGIEAIHIFNDYCIPEAERSAWMDALVQM